MPRSPKYNRCASPTKSCVSNILACVRCQVVVKRKLLVDYTKLLRGLQTALLGVVQKNKAVCLKSSEVVVSDKESVMWQ